MSSQGRSGWIDARGVVNYDRQWIPAFRLLGEKETVAVTWKQVIY